MVTKPSPLLHLVRQLTEKKLERKRKNLIRLGIEQGSRYIGRAVRGWEDGQLHKARFLGLRLQLID